MNINQSISRKIAIWCQKTLEIDVLEKAVMEYGISLFLSSVGKFIMLTMFGYVFGVGTETIVTLVVFASVRIFANGIHMKSRLRCTAMMGVVILCSIIAGKMSVLSDTGLLIGWITNLLLLYLYAPADFTGRHHYSKDQSIKNKRIAMIVTSIYFIIMLVSIKEMYRNIIVTSCMAEMITVLPIWRGRRGADASKENDGKVRE